MADEKRSKRDQGESKRPGQLEKGWREKSSQEPGPGKAGDGLSKPDRKEGMETEPVLKKKD